MSPQTAHVRAGRSGGTAGQPDGSVCWDCEDVEGKASSEGVPDAASTPLALKKRPKSATSVVQSRESGRV